MVLLEDGVQDSEVWNEKDTSARMEVVQPGGQLASEA
jgi:hypothetical protein